LIILSIHAAFQGFGWEREREWETWLFILVLGFLITLKVGCRFSMDRKNWLYDYDHPKKEAGQVRTKIIVAVSLLFYIIRFELFSFFLSVVM